MKHQKKCNHCCKDYISHRSDSLYCSPTCRSIAGKQSKKLKMHYALIYAVMPEIHLVQKPFNKMVKPKPFTEDKRLIWEEYLKYAHSSAMMRVETILSRGGKLPV